MHGDSYDHNEIKKSAIMKRKYKIKIRKLQAKKHKLDLEIKDLKKKIYEPKHEKPRKKSYKKIKIVFKIDSHDALSDIRMFSQFLFDLEKSAKENNIHLEYKVRKGSLIIELIIGFAFVIADHAFSHFIMPLIHKLRATPHMTITKIDDAVKERIARSRHEELHRSFKSIVEKTTIIIDGMTGTQYTIRDNDNVDWRYNIFDNGDFRILP